MPVWYGALYCISPYLTRPPQDLTDLETIWDLLQEGPQDLRVCGLPLLGLTRYAVVPATCHSAERHVA